MTSVLRQSGNLAGISKSLLRSTTRRNLRSSLTLVPKYYSTNNPTDPKNKPDKKAADPPSKNAPGSEHIYNGAKAPMSPPSGGPKKDEDTTAPGMVKLTPEDSKALDDLVIQIKKQLGPIFGGQAEHLEKVFATMKKQGMPQELVEVLQKIKSQQKLSLADAMRLARIAAKYTSDGPEAFRSTADKKADKPDFQSNAPKTENTSGNQKNDKGHPKSGEQKKEGFDYNLDNGTLLSTAFAAYLAYQVFFSPGESNRDITWQEFRTTFFDKGLVEKLTVEGGHRVRVDLHRDLVRQMYPDSPAANPAFHYYFTIGSVEAFERRLDEAQKELGIPSAERIPVTYVKGGRPFFELLVAFGPPILLLGALFAATRRAGGASGGGGAGGIFSMGKSRAKRFNHDSEVKVKFKDVAGMDEAKQEIMEFVAFLKTPDQFQRLGAKIPRGAILSGPPGTGKTLLAKATAGESGVPFFSVSGSEFVEMFVGVGASRVRDLFSTARKNTPCIIFIDEIDAIGKSRSKGNFGGGNDEREATLNQILTEMDGFNTSEQVVVLAGTNRADVLDQALMRPGRFDRHIAIDRPTMEGRKQIFLVHMSKVVTSEDPDQLTGRLAALTPGFSGADIANAVNEAALIAARSSATSVAQIHFEQAIERVVGGLERKSVVLKPEEKKTVAYHEAGHAICGWYFKYADPLLKVSIIPRGQGALGYAQYLPDGDTYLLNVHQLMDRMAMTLGGRVSEELHFETVTSGASDDFKKVTALATAMVTKWGMSAKMGTLYFPEHEDKLNKPFAESTAQTIDLEVRRIIDEAYKKCKDLLTEKKTEIGLVAEELLSKEVLGREDMIRLLGPRPFEDNKEFSKYFGGGMSAPPPPPTETGPSLPSPGSEVA